MLQYVHRPGQRTALVDLPLAGSSQKVRAVHYPPRLGSRFWRFWAAMGLSSLGDGMVLVGFPLLALTYTRSPTLIAGVLVVGKVPAPLVAIFAGALADRVDRRRLLVSIDVASFVVLGTFAGFLAAGVGSLVAIYTASFLLGVLAVAFSSASAASVLSLAPNRDLLVRANSRLLAVNLAGEQVVGQAVGGLVFAFARVIPFFGDAVSFLVSAAVLPPAVPVEEPEASRPTLFADVRIGIRWFWRTPLLRLMAGLIAQFAFCQAVVLGVLVLYATQDLHMSKAGYGLLLGVSAIGNIVGALAAERLHTRLGGGLCIVLAGVLAASAYPILAATKSPVTALGALTLEAVAIAVGNVTAQSLRQSIAPDELQGRAWSAYMILILAAFPLGGMVGGVLGSLIGIRTTFLLAGCVQLAVVLVSAPRLLSRIHSLEHPATDRAEPEQVIVLADMEDVPAGHGAHHDERLPAGDDGAR